MFHVLSHLSAIPMILYGSLQHWLVALLFYFLFGCIGVACTYHRLISHKSYVAPLWFEYLGLVLGSLGAVGTSIQWTAVHRAHHRYSDTDRDPHNPQGRFWAMQFFAMLVPASPRFVADLLRSSRHQRFHKYYWAIHATYALILVLIDPFAIVYAYLFPCFVLWHVMSALGTFAHTESFGYKCPLARENDRARNLWWVGLLVFGEGYHSNHHADASRWRFGMKPFELDLSAFIIRMIKKDAA